ncbi:MAG: fibronectin type III domain-containing protein [Patescibacteria group bacterium]|nr:fibronectin type III domain-containing protein [Patescibacteria group bacterium]
MTGKKIKLFLFIISFLLLVPAAPSLVKSSEIQAVPKVTNLHLVKKYYKKISLKWKRVPNAHHYQVRVLKKKNNQYRLIKKVRAEKRKKTVKNLKSGKAYYFRVRAKRNGHWGKYSKRLRVKTKTKSNPGDLIEPADLEYKGAFRVPDYDGNYEIGWEWGGQALTYTGSNSLIGTGHPYNLYFSEISIPQPVISNDKNLSDLNTADTVQNFSPVVNGLIDVSTLEIPRIGIEYLDNKIYFALGQHFQETDDKTHGYANFNLSNPNSQGLWRLKDRSPYSTNDYMFKTIDNKLASGRFRDGGWSGMGPSLFEFDPDYDSNIDNTTLLLYESSEDCYENCQIMDNYHHSDEWVGGAWLESGDSSAVIFAGTKGEGECWYGNEDGPCMECDNRGWWSTSFTGQILFYDPTDLEKVASGEMESFEPQPYNTLDIDDYLFNVTSTQQKHHLSSVAYNPNGNYLYVMEYLADNDKPLVHVWKIN